MAKLIEPVELLMRRRVLASWRNAQAENNKHLGKKIAQ